MTKKESKIEKGVRSSRWYFLVSLVCYGTVPWIDSGAIHYRHDTRNDTIKTNQNVKCLHERGAPLYT